MASKSQFRSILPSAQVALAALFGGWGLWQRNQILSHDYLFGTGWSTTARFHVWPWPYKLAAISNLPALLAGLLLTIPISALRPTLSEATQLAPTLVFVMFLWRWVGSRFDQRWAITERRPWVAIFLFMIFSLAGALLPMGYTGYLPYGSALWVVTGLALLRRSQSRSEKPHDSSDQRC